MRTATIICGDPIRSDDYTEINQVREPQDMPLCPICDNAITEYEGSAVVKSTADNGMACKALAHRGCVEEI